MSVSEGSELCSPKKDGGGAGPLLDSSLELVLKLYGSPFLS